MWIKLENILLYLLISLIQRRFFLVRSSPARFLLRFAITFRWQSFSGKRNFQFFHIFLNHSILKVTDKDQFREKERGMGARRLRGSHASRIQHGAYFIMAYTLKSICCMLVKVVARDTARLRVKVSVRFAAAGKISRDPDESRCTLESEYSGIVGG